MYWIKVVSWGLGVLSFMLLLADIIGILRTVAVYRVLAVVLIAQAVMPALLLPDPRKDWFEPAITTERAPFLHSKGNVPRAPRP